MSIICKLYQFLKPKLKNYINLHFLDFYFISFYILRKGTNFIASILLFKSLRAILVTVSLNCCIVVLLDLLFSTIWEILAFTLILLSKGGYKDEKFILEIKLICLHWSLWKDITWSFISEDLFHSHTNNKCWREQETYLLEKLIILVDTP